MANKEIDPRLVNHNAVWQRKGALRIIYKDYYENLVKALPSGRYLEIGSGSGHSRYILDGCDITRLDILSSPWINVVADAHYLPFKSNQFDGVFWIDTLHHLSKPVEFLKEVTRVLRSGGRFAMIEPGITPISWIFYNYFHKEPVDLKANPLTEQTYGCNKDPFDSNQAVPTLLFQNREYYTILTKQIPNLRKTSLKWLSLWAYPLTGGFQSWSFISIGIAKCLLRLEDHLLPIFGKWLAFRLFIAMEKK